MDVLNKIIIKTKSYREKAQASSVFDNLFAYEKKNANDVKHVLSFFFSYRNKLESGRLCFFTLSCWFY